MFNSKRSVGSDQGVAGLHTVAINCKEFCFSPSVHIVSHSLTQLSIDLASISADKCGINLLQTVNLLKPGMALPTSFIVCFIENEGLKRARLICQSAGGPSQG